MCKSKKSTEISPSPFDKPFYGKMDFAYTSRLMKGFKRLKVFSSTSFYIFEAFCTVKTYLYDVSMAFLRLNTKVQRNF